MEPKVKKSIVLPEELLKLADVAAADELRTFNGYVVKVLADKLGWKPVAEEVEEAEEVAP